MDKQQDGRHAIRPIQLATSAMVRPDILSIEYHGKILRLTEHSTKDSEKNPCVQNVNKHMYHFEKLSPATELQIFSQIFWSILIGNTFRI